jgi:hypothetical protein
VTSPKLPLISKVADISLLQVNIFQELSKIWKIGKKVNILFQKFFQVRKSFIMWEICNNQ